MAGLTRGALVEYGSDFLGPLPNVVLFQFNPQSLSRTIQIPDRNVTGKSRETDQAGEPPVEKFNLNLHFHAADQLKDSDPDAVLFGIGPRLAALEKMVYPKTAFSTMECRALDSLGDSVSGGMDSESVIVPVPREKFPRILFIWGPARILPVVIDSMTINEKLYDPLLNPIQAEVTIGLSVPPFDPCSSDWVAYGALFYTQMVKDVQAEANLKNTSQDMIVDIVTF
jgi:hypothetical protein